MKMKNKYLIFISTIILIALSLNIVACNSKHSFDNPPVKVNKISWQLGLDEDNSPWLFLNVVIENTSKKDIKSIKYYYQYTPLFHEDGDVLHKIDFFVKNGELLGDNTVIKSGDRDIFKIPVCSWRINQSRNIIEQIQDSYFCIYWVDFTGIGNWGINKDNFYKEDYLYLDAFIREIDDWNFLD